MKTLRWQDLISYGIAFVIVTVLVGHFGFHREWPWVADECVDIVFDFGFVWFLVAKKG